MTSGEKDRTLRRVCADDRKAGKLGARWRPAESRSQTPVWDAEFANNVPGLRWLRRRIARDARHAVEVAIFASEIH
jgi:hypothetical protein